MWGFFENGILKLYCFTIRHTKALLIYQLIVFSGKICCFEYAEDRIQHSYSSHEIWTSKCQIFWDTGIVWFIKILECILKNNCQKINWHVAYTLFKPNSQFIFTNWFAVWNAWCVIIIGVFWVIIYKYMYTFACKCTSIFVNLLPASFLLMHPYVWLDHFFSLTGAIWKPYWSCSTARLFFGCCWYSASFWHKHSGWWGQRSRWISWCWGGSKQRGMGRLLLEKPWTPVRFLFIFSDTLT